MEEVVFVERSWGVSLLRWLLPYQIDQPFARDEGLLICFTEWNAEEAKYSTGKCTFLKHAIPASPPGPHALSHGTPAGRSLYSFILSTDLIEIETG